MTLPTTIPARVQVRRSHLLGLVAAVAVVAAAITWAMVSFTVDTGNRGAQASAPTSAAVLASLAPKERQYVQAIASMTPAQLRAAFGTGVDAIGALGLSTRDEQYVRGIASLTPAQLKAAFGTGTVPLAALTPSERQYVQAIAAMTPVQLAAAFGRSK